MPGRTPAPAVPAPRRSAPGRATRFPCAAAIKSATPRCRRPCVSSLSPHSPVRCRHNPPTVAPRLMSSTVRVITRSRPEHCLHQDGAASACPPPSRRGLDCHSSPVDENVHSRNAEFRCARHIYSAVPLVPRFVPVAVGRGCSFSGARRRDKPSAPAAPRGGGTCESLSDDQAPRQPWFSCCFWRARGSPGRRPAPPACSWHGQRRPGGRPSGRDDYHHEYRDWCDAHDRVE